MPEKYANAVKSFYFESMSVKEIAGFYNLPEKTVETHLYRAKKLIKERWGENEY
jgi:DNA-directed RNA polymerase specialized sigma24 family protein